MSPNRYIRPDIKALEAELNALKIKAAKLQRENEAMHVRLGNQAEEILRTTPIPMNWTGAKP